MGEGGGSGGVGGCGAEAGVEAVDRLAATARTLREAVGVLQGVVSGEAVVVVVAEARRRAVSAVEELAGLLTSEVRHIPVYTCFFFTHQVYVNILTSI